MLWENLKMALVSLGNAKLRSFLTMLGIIIGVAAVTSIIAIGQGVKDSVTGEVNALGTNLLQINPGQSFGGEDGEQSGGFNPAASLGTSTLTEADLKTITELDNVDSAVPLMIVSGIVKAGDKQASGAFLMGTTKDLPKVFNKTISHGGFFTNDKDRNAVIGSKAAEQLFGSVDNAVGRNIQIRNQTYKVVGVFEKPKSESVFGGAGFDGAVMIPWEPAKGFNAGNAQIMEIDVKVSDTNQVDSVKNHIKSELKENHGGQSDFTVLTQEEQLNVFESILGILTTFIAAIAAISLIVGGVGIMNIMLVSVTERTREIGLRKAVGASSSTVLMQFLIEAVVLSLVGGALGVVVAYGQGFLVSKFAKITPVFTPEVIALAVGVSAAVGIIFGMAPAIKAARKRPIQALKAV